MRSRLRPSSPDLRRLSPLLGAATGLALLVGCGSSAPPPPWRSGHPDPGSLSLLDSAQAGSCASTAPDPEEAPAAISFQGQEYVQSSRATPAPPSLPDAVEIDHTGNWTFWLAGANTLFLLTPQAVFFYAPGDC